MTQRLNSPPSAACYAAGESLFMPVDPANNPAWRGTRAIAHANFVLTGVATTLIAPLLPYLAAHWALPDVQAGTLFTVQFSGSVAGTLLATWLLARHGFRATRVTGAICIAAGIASVALAKWPAGLACFFVVGVGLGLTIPTSNIFIAQVSGARAGAALNLLNFAWGAGAIAGPALVGLTINDVA